MKPEGLRLRSEVEACRLKVKDWEAGGRGAVTVGFWRAGDESSSNRF